MGRLPGDAHPVQAVEAAHNATPAAYMARIRRSCRATGPGVRDSVCIAMRRPVPRPSRSAPSASDDNPTPDPGTLPRARTESNGTTSPTEQG
jgi:hypothetical protein